MADIIDLVVTPPQLTEAVDLFNSRYFTKNSSGSFVNFGSSVEISFTALAGAVEEFHNETGIPLSDIAVRFIHRLDDAANQWFATVELRSLTGTGNTHGNRYRYDAPGNGTLSSSTMGANQCAQDYFDSVYFLEDSGSYIKVNPSIFVCNLTYPWLIEIVALCEQNGLVDNPDAMIVLQSATFPTDVRKPSPYALVPFPHGIAMYMRVGSTNYLGVNDPVMGIFNNNAADMGSICPPNCGLGGGHGGPGGGGHGGHGGGGNGGGNGGPGGGGHGGGGNGGGNGGPGGGGHGGGGNGGGNGGNGGHGQGGH